MNVTLYCFVIATPNPKRFRYKIDPALWPNEPVTGTRYSRRILELLLVLLVVVQTTTGTAVATTIYSRSIVGLLY